jgi:predicted RecA/RadA family phage recombinase
MEVGEAGEDGGWMGAAQGNLAGGEIVEQGPCALHLCQVEFSCCHWAEVVTLLRLNGMTNMKRVWNPALILSLGYAIQMGFYLPLTGAALSLSSQDKQADQHSSPDAHESCGRYVFNGRASDGTMLGMSSFCTSDGRYGGGRTSGIFSSPQAAQKEMGKWIAGATKIIEGKACKDGSGKVVGYRVIAYFAKTDKTDEYNAVAWTNDRQFYWLWSKNLENALTEEKRINTANASEQEIARPK